jgi:ParB family transcriptional regulator, chromosome partitioning protein
MSEPRPEQHRRSTKVAAFQERRLGGTVIRTRRSRLDVTDLIPNERQPRIGPKQDEELQRQIEANQGLFEPLLVEPHPDIPDKFRIVDGERRWTNSIALVEEGKAQFRQVPVEITDRTLTDEERLRAWIYIHRQRKEWDAKEKEMVAYRLVELVGRASAANILGITVRELDKLVQVFELSQRMENLRDPTAAITWARELMGVNKALLTPSIVDAVVKKVGRQQITNSKDLRKLRVILRDPVARAHFVEDDATIDSSLLRVAGQDKQSGGLISQLDATMKTIRGVPWTELEELKGDPRVVKRVAEAEELLRSLRLNLST